MTSASVPVEAALAAAGFREEPGPRWSLENSESWVPLLVFPGAVETLGTDGDARQRRPARPSDLIGSTGYLHRFLTATPAGGLQ